jgi:hypothetical protein
MVRVTTPKPTTPSEITRWRTLTLNWRDRDSGELRSAWVHPPLFPTTASLAIPLSGRPTQLQIELGSELKKITIESIEWMVGSAP